MICLPLFALLGQIFIPFGLWRKLISLKDNICIFVKLHFCAHISEKLKAFKKLKKQGFSREKIYESIATDDFFNISKN